MKLKSVHGLRVGDIVKYEKERKLYVVSGVEGWIHSSFRTEDKKIDSHISLTREIGHMSFLTNASRCKLIKRREDVGSKWWLAFPNGEK